MCLPGKVLHHRVAAGRERGSDADAGARHRPRSELRARPCVEGLRARAAVRPRLVRRCRGVAGDDHVESWRRRCRSTRTTRTCIASSRRYTSTFNRFDKALYHQERALELSPNYDLVVVQQGEVLTWLGRPGGRHRVDPQGDAHRTLTTRNASGVTSGGRSTSRVPMVTRFNPSAASRSRTTRTSPSLLPRRRRRAMPAARPRTCKR